MGGLPGALLFAVRFLGLCPFLIDDFDSPLLDLLFVLFDGLLNIVYIVLFLLVESSVEIINQFDVPMPNRSGIPEFPIVLAILGVGLALPHKPRCGQSEQKCQSNAPFH